MNAYEWLERAFAKNALKRQLADMSDDRAVEFVANRMDKALKETLSQEDKYRNSLQYLKRYMELHKAKYGEEFEV